MKIQKIVSGVLSVSMLAGMGTMSAFAADDTQKAGISVRVQDKTTGEYEAVVFNDELGMPYQNENDRTMTPLRTIANAMDLEVAWNEEAKTATFTRGNESVVFTIDSNKYQHVVTEEGKDPVTEELTMDTAAVQKDNRTYAPVRFLAEAMDYDVAWDEASLTVTLAAKGETVVTGYENARPLLLQGAMDIEMQDMVKALADAETVDIDNYHFVRGMLNGYPVVVSRTEQGISNAAVTTALAMQHFDPIAVINQGTSGGHDPELHTFDIVLGETSVPASATKSVASAEGAGVDYKAIEPAGVYAYDKDQKTFVKKFEYKADKTLLETAQSVADTYTKGKVVTGVISSADSWNNQIDRMLYLNELWGSSTEEMETNAVAQICQTYDVSFLGIRILSNTGIYGEDFNPESGPACQEYVLTVAKTYIDNVLKKQDVQKADAAVVVDYKSDKRPILLQGAMDIEMQDMVKTLTDTTEYTIGQWYYVAGQLDGYPVVVSRTEQGLANAGASTALAMEYFNPVAVINQGTSGGHDPELHTFDIVLGETTVPSAAWMTEASAKGTGVDYKAMTMNGVYAYDKNQKTFVKEVKYPGDETLLNCAQAVAETYNKGKVVKGVISSSDEWNNQIDRMLFLHELNGSSCEEMESNSVAQVCKTYNVPYLGIRILSNTGIYGEDFNPETGSACQEYVLNVAKNYIQTVLNK